MGRALRAEIESRDILQSVLLKSLTRLAQVRDPAAVMGWLSRMADNEIRDRVDYEHRQRRDAVRRLPLDEGAMELPSPVRQALSLAIVAEDSERLARALEALPEAQREAIVLRKLEELTFPEMAARLGKSEDACRMTFARAMAALTLQLRDRILAMPSDLETLFGRLVEHHVMHGAMPPIEEIAAGQPDLVAPLRALAQEYLELSTRLDGDGSGAPSDTPSESARPLPLFDGFQTIERLGAGGMGEVYKLRDLKLDRFVAGKVVRADRGVQTGLSAFLHEARSMALFKDRRIVQVFEFRADATPPVIVMEYVEGFELGRIGPSLEYGQRARILRDVCDAIGHAHALGIQHRDLKPSNIMLDASLSPKILDFGLSGADPAAGHFRGTLHYLAPEQLDRSQPIDARTDVYALGVILYELLCGVPPFTGVDQATVLEAIRRDQPRLPIEIDPRVPEPLQAIALKAMERRAGRSVSDRA